ncbi:hypothetical protein MRB53_038809 [Persea americana]|nr:hypothetical protein MRB53_038809 [Persea americana]
MTSPALRTTTLLLTSRSRFIGPGNPIIQHYKMTTTSSAGVHATRAASGKEQEIIDEVLDLYQLKPSDKAYSHYAETAVFHDPVSIARGLESIKSQFNGMPKLFASSTTKKCDVLESSTPQKLELNLTQHYVFKSMIPLKKTGAEKTVNSKITLHMNSAGLIEEHDEEWDHEANKDGSDGFMGKIQEARKKASAKLVESTVTSDPKKV